MRSVAARALAWLAVVGCRIHDVDVTGRPCPCPSGWTCEPATTTCALGDAGTTVDAAGDAAAIDAPATIPNLAFWFRLDESTGTVAVDSSGHGGDGVVSLLHTMWVPAGGKLAGALHLDGTPYGSCMAFPATCTTPPGFAASLTVTGWVNFDSLHTAPFSLGDFAAAQGTSGGTQGGWAIGATDKCGTETLGFSVTPDTNSTIHAVRCGATAITAGTWYYVTGVFDGATLTQDLYINGVNDDGALAGGVTPSALYVPPACPKLGCPSNQANVMAGLVDEFRIYDRALSPSEVMTLYTMSGG